MPVLVRSILARHSDFAVRLCTSHGRDRASTAILPPHLFAFTPQFSVHPFALAPNERRHLFCTLFQGTTEKRGLSVWRVRFHGRGGHGVKTASRILGSAAFYQGFHVQDAPVYGAERRGAAIAAFTRIDTQPILERGMVANPDLIIVADETLLPLPACGALLGNNLASAMFVNSPGDGKTLANQCAIPCPVFTLDLTMLTIEKLGRGSALSAALGAAACALLGFLSEDIMARAVQTELADLSLSPELIARNVELAHRVFSQVPAVPIRQPTAPIFPSAMHCPAALQNSSEGVPVIYATGNSPARHTGSWRVFRPVIDLETCTRCGICFALCPDGAISLDAQGYPIIDYDNCKGCMICYQECPIHCIGEEKEVRAW